MSSLRSLAFVVVAHFWFNSRSILSIFFWVFFCIQETEQQNQRNQRRNQKHTQSVLLIFPKKKHTHFSKKKLFSFANKKKYWINNKKNKSHFLSLFFKIIFAIFFCILENCRGKKTMPTETQRLCFNFVVFA